LVPAGQRSVQYRVEVSAEQCARNVRRLGVGAYHDQGPIRKAAEPFPDEVTEPTAHSVSRHSTTDGPADHEPGPGGPIVTSVEHVHDHVAATTSAAMANRASMFSGEPQPVPGRQHANPSQCRWRDRARLRQTAAHGPCDDERR
jgi:hypothetical protein